jgi:hypothetical protein
MEIKKGREELSKRLTEFNTEVAGEISPVDEMKSGKISIEDEHAGGYKSKKMAEVFGRALK